MPLTNLQNAQYAPYKELHDKLHKTTEHTLSMVVFWVVILFSTYTSAHELG
jgi:hypothetical protein